MRLAEVHGLVTPLVGFASLDAAGARVGVAGHGPVSHAARRLQWDDARTTADKALSHTNSLRHQHVAVGAPLHYC